MKTASDVMTKKSLCRVFQITENAGNTKIIRKHTFMISNKIYILLCFQPFLCAKHLFNEGYFYSRSFQKYSRTSEENFMRSFWLCVRLLSTVFRPRTSFPLTKYSRINGHVLNRPKTVNLRPDHNFRSPFFPPFYLVNIPIAAELNEPALHLLVSSADTCVPARVEDFSP